MAAPFDGLRVVDLSGTATGASVREYLTSRGAAVTDVVASADVVIAGRGDSVDEAATTSVVVVVSPFGGDGPWAGYLAGDAGVLASSGLSALTGPLGGAPTVLDDALGPAGPLTTLAVVAALDERRRTGKGVRIDLAEVQASLQGLWTTGLDFTVNGREQSALGARDVQSAPHGVYRCKDGNWIAIATHTDEEWFALKVALGRPDWCELERMQTAASRLNEQREIDHHIGHWINEQTRRADESPTLVITMLDNLEVPRYTSHELAAYFQSYGVPAAVVERPSA